MTELAQVNEDKMQSEEKGLYYIWNFHFYINPMVITKQKSRPEACNIEETEKIIENHQTKTIDRNRRGEKHVRYTATRKQKVK